MPDDLPPLVALVQANIDQLLARLDQAEARIQSLTDASYTATVNADGSQADTVLDDLTAKLRAWGASTATATAKIDIGPALAEIAKLKVAQEAASGGGGGGGFFSGLLGAMTGGTEGGAGGLLNNLFRGPGTGMFGLPGMFSLGSLAGLGPEHLLTTLGGLGASGIGAMAGGGLLAGASAGVAGVGMGTDLAGMGQAAGDIKTVTTAMTALNTATATYGKNSTQAQRAQLALNQALTAFSPIAETAVYQASQTVEQFKAMFDQMTGQAEKTGAEIITQLIQVGEKFLPVIGTFAAQNTKIIQGAIQPFLAWLQGPGLAIFTELEKKFQQDLPSAIGAMTQGFELLARTIGYIAPETGKFTQTLDNLFTKMNSPEGWAKWTTTIDKLIGDFHTWADFLKAVGTTIFDIFKNDAGTATAIIDDLTQMVDKLKTYVNSATGSASLQNLFTVHKNEILALLQLIPPLVAVLGHIELVAAPPLVQIVTMLAKAALAVINFLQQFGDLSKLIDFALGIGLILAKLNLIGPALAGVKYLWSTFAASIAADDAAVVASTDTMAEGVMAALGSTGIGGAIVLLGVAVTAMSTNWSSAWSTMQSLAASAANFVIDNVLNPLISDFDKVVSVVTLGIVHLKGEISQVTTAAQNAAKAVQTTFSVHVKEAGGGGADQQLPGGTTQAEANKIQALVNGGLSVSQAIAAAKKSVPIGTAAPTASQAAMIQAGLGGVTNPVALPSPGGGSTAGQAAVPSQAATQAASAAATRAAALISQAQSVQTQVIGNITSQNLAQLRAVVNQTHSHQFQVLISELKGVHTAAANNMVKQLSADHKEALSALTAEEVAIAQAQAAAQVNATVTANHQMAQAVQTAAANVSSAAATLASDASKLATDQSNSTVNAINNQTAISTDQANAQVQAIGDASAIQVDQLEIANSTGAQQLAYQAQLALDIQKQTDHAQIAADQLALDQQKATDQANIDAAQAHLDSVQQTNDQRVTAAQAALDAGTITQQSIVNAATIANAVADAGQNTKLQKTTAQNLQNAINGQTRTLDQLQGNLSGAQNDAAGALSDAQTNLANIQNAANNMEALLTQALTNDTNSAAVTEAQLQAVVDALNTQASIAANAASAASAATTTTTPVTTQITVVTQVDGQTIALVTTPYIRQQILRTTARQTQNVFGGAAGRTIPSIPS